MLFGAAGFGLYRLLESSPTAPSATYPPGILSPGTKRGADPAIEFPEALGELPVNPDFFGLDAERDALWFAEQPAAGGGPVVYRYDLRSARMQSFQYLSVQGAPIISTLLVDPRGHVLIGHGSSAVDVDPSGAVQEHSLGNSQYPPMRGGGTSIKTAMFVDDKGDVFISRTDSAAITRFDPDTGTLREFPYPSSFGTVEAMAVVDDSIWITNPTSSVNGIRAGTGRVSMETGEFVAVSRLLTGFSDRPIDGRLFAADPDTGIVSIGADGQIKDEFSLKPLLEAEPFSGLGFEDRLVVDEERGFLWVASAGRRDISRIDLNTGSVREYDLPVFVTTADSCPIGIDCNEPMETSSRPNGIALAANGDLYFSDLNFRRVGIVRTSE
jgi:sugar lactone lactonase YvrE